MNSIIKPLIIGGSHHNTYGLIRCFGEASVKVDLILHDCKNSYIDRSRYIDRLWYCDTPLDVLNKLLELISVSSPFYAIFTASDAIASLLDIHYEELLGNCYFFNCCKTGTLTYYMSKEVQAVMAKNAGLYVPIMQSFGNNERLVFRKFPCIIKPLASIEGGKRIAICHSQEELDKKIALFAGVKRVLIQHYLPKDEEIVLLGASLRGSISIPGYIIKYRDELGGTSYSKTASSEELDRQLIESAKLMIKLMNYEGLFGIEFIKCGTAYYFIEVNLRNDATSYSLAIAGANLPLMYYQALTEGKKLTDVNPVVESLHSMVELVDFKNVLHHKVGLLKWLKQRKEADCRYFYNPEDIKPYKKARREFVSYLLRRSLHK